MRLNVCVNVGRGRILGDLRAAVHHALKPLGEGGRREVARRRGEDEDYTPMFSATRDEQSDDKEDTQV